MNKDTILIIVLESLTMLFTLVFSVVNHFLYEQSGRKKWIAPFVPVNESVWEHGKLLFVPFVLISCVEAVFIGGNPNFIFAKAIPALLCIPVMIVLFYTYSGVLGKNILWVDILLAIGLSLAMNVFSMTVLLCEHIFPNFLWLIPLTIFEFILIILFTFIPPKIALFRDSITGNFGIPIQNSAID